MSKTSGLPDNLFLQPGKNSLVVFLNMLLICDHKKNYEALEKNVC